MASELTTEKSLENIDDLRYASLWRLTGGIPQNELKTILQEASDCEVALEKEIALLEAAAIGEGPITDGNDATLASMDSSLNNKSQHGGSMDTGTAGGRSATAGDSGSGSAAVADGNGTNSVSGSATTNSANTDRSRSATNANNNTTGNANSGHNNATSTTSTTTASTVPALPREYDATSTSGPNYLSSAKDILSTELTPLGKLRFFAIFCNFPQLQHGPFTPVSFNAFVRSDLTISLILVTLTLTRSVFYSLLLIGPIT